MFNDELEQVLRGVPYSIWEQITQRRVERVNVQRTRVPFEFGGGRTSLRVVIYYGMFEYEVLEDFDTFGDPVKELLCLWEPYRELIEREVDHCVQILSENPPQYQYPDITEQEFDERLRQMCSSEQRNELGEYIFRLNLKDELKENCFQPDLLPSEIEKMISDTAFDLIYETIRKEQREWLEEAPEADETETESEDNPEATEAPQTIEVTEDIRADFEELIGYLDDVLEQCWTEKALREVLDAFFYQSCTIREFYHEADCVVEDVFSELSERKGEFYRMAKIDRGLIQRTLDPRNTEIQDGWKEGVNPFARGYAQGIFYTYVSMFYTLWTDRINWPQKRRMFLEGNSQIEPLLAAIEESAEEYFREPKLSFEEVEAEIRFYEPNIEDEAPVVYGSLDRFGITKKGKDREEVIRKIRDDFKWGQDIERIDRCLKLAE